MKKKDKAETSEIHVYLPIPIAVKLEKLAAREKRSKTQQVVVILEKELNREGSDKNVDAT